MSLKTIDLLFDLYHLVICDRMSLCFNIAVSLVSLLFRLESIKQEGILIMHLALGSLRACHRMTNEDCSLMIREYADNIM